MKDKMEKAKNKQLVNNKNLSLLGCSLFDLIDEPVISCDLDNKILLWNQGAAKKYGWEKEEVFGKEENQLLKTKSNQDFRQIKKVITKEGKWEGELIQEKSDGRKIIVWSKWVYDKDKKGNPVAIIKINNEITREKRVETALDSAYQEAEKTAIKRTVELQEANELLARIFSSTYILFAYLDPDFNFITVNKAYADAEGKSIDYFTGKNHFDLYPNQENLKIFKEVLATGKTYLCYEKLFVYPGKPGKATYWDWTLEPIKDPFGQVEGLLLCLVDVTERKLQQKELIEAERELSDAQRLSSLGTLAASIAHQLRTPLSVIKMAVFNIKRKSKNPEIAKHLENIEKKISESSHTITNLLAYSRLKQPDLEEVYLDRLLTECIKTHKKVFPKKEIVIKKDLKILKNIIFKLDFYQTKEILNNILTNAYQASPKRSTIEIRAEREKGSNFLIKFLDQGPGINKENIKRIFEPFFSSKKTGTGLGLSLVKELVDLNRGKIYVESEEGRGATVTLEFSAEDIPAYT
ncbi:MAG: PAS domain S-box protein [Candidatus Omnitrophica bacterium]|nr:PAS domain S-box protein [Candidatus Omnitrophota bacterium]MCF7909905.1 PAS domain S-box protein [Candidatus Omnitrophota bacterium]